MWEPGRQNFLTVLQAAQNLSLIDVSGLCKQGVPWETERGPPNSISVPKHFLVTSTTASSIHRKQLRHQGPEEQVDT